MDGTELINTESQTDESKKRNIIHVNKCDFEVFEALAMDLASNTNQNANNTSFITGSPPGSFATACPRQCLMLLQESIHRSCL